MADVMQDIHEIRPPVAVGMDPALVKTALIALGCLVLAGILIYLFKRFWKPSKKKQAHDAVTTAIPPYEAALKGLDRLGFKTNADPKVFYFELNALMKAYIGGIHEFNAAEMTTQELSKRLRSTKMDPRVASKVGKFQDHCDPFRYAPVRPEPERAGQDLKKARQLIDAMEADVNQIREAEAALEKDLEKESATTSRNRTPKGGQ